MGSVLRGGSERQSSAGHNGLDQCAFAALYSQSTVDLENSVELLSSFFLADCLLQIACYVIKRYWHEWRPPVAADGLCCCVRRAC